MNIELDLTIAEALFRGNSLDIDCHINQSLEDCTINAELFDMFYSSIKLSSVVETEIEILDEEDGTFIIHIDKNLTNNFHLVSYLEIDLTDADGKTQTIWFSPIKFVDNIYLRA